MGWWTEYDGLTLAIINGAGHMVPSDKPHAAYEMFSNFLGRWLMLFVLTILFI